MSYSTISQATVDVPFQNRVAAAVAREAWNSASLAATAFGELARESTWSAMLQMIWPVAIDTEAAYESAVIAGNPDPGGDPAVVTDAAILSATQAHWPPDPA
jgi:hypothetical protein